jgi:hypothetical protein
MFFTDKLYPTRNECASTGYASQAIEAMRLIHNSFVIMAEKLKIALHRNIITDKEYNEWMRCFHLLQDGWLNRDVNSTDDILFLQWVAKSSMEEAKRLRM